MGATLWDEAKYGLGVAAMDATHREFLDQAAALAQAGDTNFPPLFLALVDHTRRHFDQESALMRSCRFPATAEHEGEHGRILAELEHLARRVAAGRIGMARAYAQGLPGWFANHLATMDAALAACLKERAA